MAMIFPTVLWSTFVFSIVGRVQSQALEIGTAGPPKVFSTNLSSNKDVPAGNSGVVTNSADQVGPTAPAWINTWTAPKEYIKWFPYYLSGHDYEGAPVYVIEIGNFKPQVAIRETVGGGQRAKEIASKYFEQGVYWIVQDGLANGTGVALILDFAGFDLIKYANPVAIQVLMGVMSHFNRIHTVLNYAFLINVNFAGENLLRLSKPFIGNILEKCEIFGPQKSKWLPRLMHKIPQSQLPPWYGGDENWRWLQIGGSMSRAPSNATKE